MALKAILESLEGLSDEVKALYVEKDGKFVLDVEGAEDNSGLKSALDKERARARELEKQQRMWRDLGKTPEEIQALVEAQRKQEEENAKKAGEWDKLKAQMVEKHNKQLLEKDEAIKGMQSSLEKYLIEASATEAIAASKGVPALLIPHVRSSAKVVREENGDYSVRIVDVKGDPRVNQKGEYLTIKDLVEEMKASDIFGRAFDGSGKSGGGKSPETKGSGTPYLLSRADAKDPAKYRAAKEAAEKAGQDLQIAPE